MTIQRIFERCIREKAVRASRSDEQTLSLKSFRKYVFNAIDACRDISPEWRSMLKGRDLGVEKYYSKENVEKLREVYATKIYPLIWKREELDEWQLKKEMAIRVLAAAGLDAVSLLKAQPHLTNIPEQLEFLDNEIKKMGMERRKTSANGGKPYESKIVSEDELVQYVEEGWEICRELSNGKIVIRRPLAS